jgi:hypothetical protein
MGCCHRFIYDIDKLTWHLAPRIVHSNSTKELHSEHSLSWEEIISLLWKMKVHYHVHNSQPLVPIPSPMHPAHTFLPYFHKIHSNIILPSTPRSSEWSLPLRLPTKILLCISQLSRACTCPAHLVFLNLIPQHMFKVILNISDAIFYGRNVKL